MMHSIFKVGCWLASGICLYAGALLYEDERRRIQSRLENWWVALADVRQAAYTGEGALLRRVLFVLSGLLDSLFGRKLLSSRAFAGSMAISITFSAGMLRLLGLFSFTTEVDDSLNRNTSNQQLALILFVGVVIFVCARYRAFAASVCVILPIIVAQALWSEGWGGLISHRFLDT
jgi:hypothetical protein